MDNQILYKLGGIESQVSSIRDDITKVVRRLEERIDDDRVEVAKELKAIEDRLKATELMTRIHDDWIKAWAVRSAMILGIFSVFWLLFGSVVIKVIGGLHIGG